MARGPAGAGRGGLARRPGAAPADELARVLVLAVEALVHRAPAPAGHQRERIHDLVGRVLG